LGWKILSNKSALLMFVALCLSLSGFKSPPDAITLKEKEQLVIVAAEVT
jgi:hypothetical protein